MATTEVVAGSADPAHYVVRLRISNRSDAPVSFLNLDMGIPSPGWTYSRAAHQVSLFLSFHYLFFEPTDETVLYFSHKLIDNWATPALLPKWC